MKNSDIPGGAARVIAWSPIYFNMNHNNKNWLLYFGPALERHLSEIRNPERKSASCSAWNLLYHILHDAGFPEIPGELRFTARGKPYFADSSDAFAGDPDNLNNLNNLDNPGGKRIYFSLSHSGELCAAVVSDIPVGIDIERAREFYRPALIRRVLSDREKASFDGDFARVWCRKESIAKLTGDGVADHPAMINTLDPRYTFREISIDWRGAAYRLSCALRARVQHIFGDDAANRANISPAAEFKRRRETVGEHKI